MGKKEKKQYYLQTKGLDMNFKDYQKVKENFK